MELELAGRYWGPLWRSGYLAGFLLGQRKCAVISTKSWVAQVGPLKGWGRCFSALLTSRDSLRALL